MGTASAAYCALSAGYASPYLLETPKYGKYNYNTYS